MKSTRFLKILISSTIICTSLLTLSNCNTVEKTSNKMPSNKIAKDSIQYLNIPIKNIPETLDPNKAISKEAITLLTAVNEGLVRCKYENGVEKIVPAGAKNWTISDNGLVWTFNLREYKWSDGKPVTASHFADSIYRLLDSNNGFYYSYMAFDIKNAENFFHKKVSKTALGLRVIDDKTLEITLEKPTPHFDKKLVFTAFQPIRLDIINKLGDNFNSYTEGQVFSGPFIINNWDTSSNICIKKNDLFWDKDNVYMNTVNLLFSNSIDEEILNFKNKTLDFCIPPLSYGEKWLEDKNSFKNFKVNSPTVSFIQFNQNTGGDLGLMKNKNIRKSISLAINRDDYKNLISHKDLSAYGLIPNKIALGNKEFRALYDEPLKALCLDSIKNKDIIKDLFKLGLKEMGLSNLTLSDYSLNLLIFAEGNSNSSTINWWKKNFEENLGININTNICTDISTFQKLKSQNLYDITFNSYNGDFNDPLSFFNFWLTNNGHIKNYGGYSNPYFDKLFSKLYKEKEFLKRGDIYSQMENLLICEDVALAPYSYKETNLFFNNYVYDLFSPTFGPLLEFRWSYTSGR